MPAGPFHRILVGWDASPAAHTALVTALSLADGQGTVIARAVLTPPEHAETRGEQRRDMEAQRDWLEDQFTRSVHTAPTRGAHVRLEWGEHTDVPDDLRTCATDHGCDLVVVGRHGEDSRLRIAGLGPVARAMVQDTDLPVLLVSATATR
ncbi:Nucleotide-binding universal stress protein, UspA family [Actinacidiphila alni]|uniref:Nucleotide-binding universal stress protein, UspA family n=1 Tax=Actinacidiphila alni TaxID=380248 RepID=A0A1I2AS61_9ACTN|nr:universal stress protein [Actinacidiphila alni]SFE46732.1 Nucleotide-binding universal stress protein, UspA family [Actinacidiphila alni]